MAKRKRANDMKYHYTYRITNIKERMYYYGVHSCDCLPKEDIGVKYWSSSKRDGFVKHQKQNPEQYKYKVIKIFNTRVEAVEHEIFLHKKFDVKLHEKFYNNANQTSTGFDTAGIKFTNNNYRQNKTMMYYNNTQKFIDNILINDYISNGWVIGYLPRSKEHSNNISKGKKGKPASNKGIPCSEEQKIKISMSKSGSKMTESARKNISDRHKGLPGTTTNKIKINNGTVEKFIDSELLIEFISKDWKIGVIDSASRASVIGKTLVNNGTVNKYIFIDELDKYISDGWNKGNFRSKKV